MQLTFSFLAGDGWYTHRHKVGLERMYYHTVGMLAAGTNH